jgi:uncharacterized membrane protein
MDIALRIFFVALFIYPIWAIPLSIIISSFLAKKFQGMSFTKAWLAIFCIDMALFFPIVINGEGIVMIGPWYILFVDNKYAHFLPGLALISTAIFLVLSLLFVNHTRVRGAK